LVVAVAHDRFRRLNLHRLQMLMKQPAALVDMGQVVDPVKAEKRGLCTADSEEASGQNSERCMQLFSGQCLSL